jgi:hypothetical protein
MVLAYTTPKMATRTIVWAFGIEMPITGNTPLLIRVTDTRMVVVVIITTLTRVVYTRTLGVAIRQSSVGHWTHIPYMVHTVTRRQTTRRRLLQNSPQVGI